MNEIAVVTAVAGDYDNVYSHEYYCDNVDYIFFTDGTVKPKDKIWQTQFLPDVELPPAKLAKYPKLNPHFSELLSSYRYVIWIDGSMVIINPNFVEEILSEMNNGIVLSPHFDGRDCGYGEATIRPPKYAKEPLDEQCDFYRNEGFPEHYGLWECGVQARDMHNKKVQEFGELWMQQVIDWSIQDQVSCGYALWKTGLVPSELRKSWRDYNWLALNLHKQENSNG